MSGTRHRALILIGAFMLTALAVVAFQSRLGAGMRSDDAEQADELSSAPLLGRTYQVSHVSACSIYQQDTWRFAASGQLVGQTISGSSTWRQSNLWSWTAVVGTSCDQFLVSGRTFGRVIFGLGQGLGSPYYFWVTGIRE